MCVPIPRNCHGIAEAPLIEGDWIYFARDHPKSFVKARMRRTETKLLCHKKFRKVFCISQAETLKPPVGAVPSRYVEGGFCPASKFPDSGRLCTKSNRHSQRCQPLVQGFDKRRITHLAFQNWIIVAITKLFPEP